MGSTNSSWVAKQGVLDEKGGRVPYVQRHDFVGTSTTAAATTIVIPKGAVITRVFMDVGVAPSAATTFDLGVSGNTDSIVDGESLGTTALRRVTVADNDFRLQGFTEDTTVWSDFSRTDAAARLALFVEYILPLPAE